MTADTWAGVRDASWYDRPRTHGRIIVHVAVERQPVAACDRGRPVAPWGPARTVPTVLRCRRRGCARLWPTEAPR